MGASLLAVAKSIYYSAMKTRHENRTSQYLYIKFLTRQFPQVRKLEGVTVKPVLRGHRGCPPNTGFDR